MAELLPVSVIAGNPNSSTAGSLSDNTKVVDWYSYFYAAKVPLSQDHNLSSSDTEASQPVLASPSFSVVITYELDAVVVVSGQPIVSTTGLIQNYNLQANDVVSSSPVVTDATLSETKNFSPDNLLSGTPDVGSPSLAQNSTLDASGVTTEPPELGSPSDPNKIVAQEIEEIQQMFGGWPRRAYEVPDGRLVQAEREIFKTFGDKVSIDKKSKSLVKFGKSAELSTNGMATIWTVGGHETYVDDNLITHISSSSDDDVYEVILECHTVEGTGTDQKFTFLTQTVTLQGQTKVALPIPVARVSEVTNNNGVELVGRVVVYEDVAVTNGIPDDETKIHIDIEAGMQNSFKAATTFSDSDYYVLTGGFGSVSLKQSASADFFLEVRQAGKVFIQRAAVSASSGGPWDLDLDPAVIIPKNADVRITVETDTNNAVVFGVFKGYLAEIIN